MNSLDVCILTAGKGTRLGEIGQILNKALLPIDGKAAISHIIEKFPPNTNFIIALGYLGSQVKEYLSIAHTNEKFTFVNVDKYEGVGTGPGYSLMSCRDSLKKNFFFVSCDTLFTDSISEKDTDVDWFGAAKIPKDQRQYFCNFLLDSGNKIIKIFDKIKIDEENIFSFVGLCHIKSYHDFWAGLEGGKLINQELQISSGIESICASNKASAREISWFDVGTLENYKSVRSQYEEFDFSKPDEFTFFINKRVIKFFKNTEVVSKKVQRSDQMKDVTPKCYRVGLNYYYYNFVDGETLYAHLDENIFRKLILFLESNLWTIEIGKIHSDSLSKDVKKFYYEKTLERVAKYKAESLFLNENLLIQNKMVPNVDGLLSMVPWQNLFEAIPSCYHGDLQFDNIIFDQKTTRFMLIDWRHEFGGSVFIGDRYYDLAKLYGGINMNYDLIKKSKFSFASDDKNISFEFEVRPEMKKYKQIFEEYINQKGYSLKKVKLLTALIYLNMSPLHNEPFSHLLFNYGKYLLNEELSKN